MENALPDADDIAELREHLCRPLPELPTRYLYDDHGSALFEQITQQPEFYPARTEWRLLQALAPQLLEELRPRHVAEIGSGAGRKIRLLLDLLSLRGLPVSCSLLDINAAFVERSLETLRQSYMGVDFRGIQANFLDELYRLGPGGDRLILFLAGTLGNLHPDKVPGFLTMVAEVMAPGDAFLLGVDLVKDREALEAAYNDRAGVTAAFNKNILTVINDRFGADFDLANYDHRAFYDRGSQWVEMRLRSRVSHKVRIPAADLALNMKAGQELRTELSCKYTRRSLEDRARNTGLVIDRWVTDPHELFALALLRLA